MGASLTQQAWLDHPRPQPEPESYPRGHHAVVSFNLKVRSTPDVGCHRRHLLGTAQSRLEIELVVSGRGDGKRGQQPGNHCGTSYSVFHELLPLYI
jgi:hypothetical protein